MTSGVYDIFQRHEMARSDGIFTATQAMFEVRPGALNDRYYVVFLQ